MKSARRELNPIGTLIRRPGLTETTRGPRCTTCESNAAQAPYQKAQGLQPVVVQEVSCERRDSNLHFAAFETVASAVGLRSRVRVVRARGVEPPQSAGF